jgi:serine/threonine-protein kinase
VTQEYSAVNTRVGRTAGGKYKLVRLLGKGGMGEVYEAQHSVIGRRFAIKFLHPHLAANSEVVARFQREAQAAGSLENENIAAVVDAGTADDGAPFLVMEYLDGEDLAHLLVRGGPLPVPRAAYIIIQACRGLAAAHGRGIVHRDLKPENLFVCKRNDTSDLIKVLDFGIAKLHAGSAGTGLTQTGTTMGTPFYMSLEQARGAKEVGQRTDIYALGVILYEILSGAKPHPGESYNEILYHVLTQEPAPLDSIRPELPAGLSAVVQKAMAREAGERYASAADLTTALIPYAGRAVTPLRSQVGMAVAIGETMKSPVSLRAIPVPTPPSPPEPPSPVPARGRSRAVVWSSWAAGAVALVAVGLWLGLHYAPRRPAPLPTPAQLPAPVPPFGGFGTDSPPHLPPRASHAPVAAPTPDPTPAPAATPPLSPTIESPPERPPGRPPGQHLSKRATPTGAPTAAAKASPVDIPAAKPAENSQNPPNPGRKSMRPLDHSNPFAE